MDNDAAKAEFLGMDLKQFRAWELSTQIPEQIKLPSMDIPNNASELIIAPAPKSTPAPTPKLDPSQAPKVAPQHGR